MSSTLRSTLPARAALGAAGAAALLLAAAPAASAHVRAVPDSTAAGSWSVVTLRVPNESDTAATTALSVTLPADTPFTSVSVEPVPGWTAVVREEALPEPVQVSGATVTRAPRTVTWTADPGTPGVGVGQFQRFALSVGPLPAEGTRVLLPAVQTYADGEVADWSQVADPGAEEPESPAPGFTTTAAADDAHAAHGAAATGAGTGAGTGQGAAAGAAGTTGAALVLALLRRRGPAPR
ncbi:YcnI family copper-binding membrane protein [Kineococcus indalonis]|uniref:YcnI family copper-binding membrane protein n=1 Tax=Kineococcus indalonis TaxID=2696566 RepID=UPI0014129A71|nr:YcnI family protein [Kineococcus indalonis]NAZ88509.1 DUF1775 domain-containing protein [Kineococcus indalonis]